MVLTFASILIGICCRRLANHQNYMSKKLYWSALLFISILTPLLGQEVLCPDSLPADYYLSKVASKSFISVIISPSFENYDTLLTYSPGIRKIKVKILSRPNLNKPIKHASMRLSKEEDRLITQLFKTIVISSSYQANVDLCDGTFYCFTYNGMTAGGYSNKGNCLMLCSLTDNIVQEVLDDSTNGLDHLLPWIDSLAAVFQKYIPSSVPEYQKWYPEMP